MSKSFNYFYAFFSLTLMPEVALAKGTPGSIMIGARFEETLLKQVAPTTILGLSTVEDFTDLMKNGTRLTLRSVDELAALEAVVELSIELAPTVVNRTNAIWGSRYTTRIPVSRKVDLREAAAQLLEIAFKYPGTAEEYKIVSGSIKEIRSRRTKGRLG